MFITQKCLPRRTFLRGMGATLALPLLDSMVPALSAMAKTSANPVRRLGFIYFPHGSTTWAGEQNMWTPSGEGAAFELSPILKKLEPVKNQMLVLTNMEHKNAQGNGTDGNAEHTRSNASWLSAARPKMTEGADIRLATTVDQIAAKQICQDTRLPSLELTLENSFLVGNCRQRLQLRVRQQPVVVLADNAAPHGEQPAHGVRAIVRRRRDGRRASCRDAKGPEHS